MGQGDERIQEEAIVVVARGHDRHAGYAGCQRPVHIRAEEMRVEQIVLSFADQLDEPPEGERIEARTGADEVDGDIQSDELADKLAAAVEIGHLDLKAVSMRLPGEGQDI